MFKVLAGNLSATFNLDGGHLERYLQKKDAITKSLCEEIILHDQILIPTHDYLTACGIFRLLGEKNFITLLQSDKVRFLRLRGVFGYVRGTGRDGSLAVFLDPASKRPQDSPVEISVEAGLSVIADQMKERNVVRDLLIRNSISLETSEIIHDIRPDIYSDLKATNLWNDKYKFPKKDLLALPGMKKMQVRVLGPGLDMNTNIVDSLLSLAMFNVELYLMAKHGCTSSSTVLPLGDLINLKLNRLTDESTRSKNMWSLFEINNIPDFGKIDLSNETHFKDLIKLSDSRNAKQFREWFHPLSRLEQNHVFKEYIQLINDVPWAQQLPAKVIRFLVPTAVGVIEPISGTILGLLDAFVIDSLVKGKSPKYFIENLQDFRDKINFRK